MNVWRTRQFDYQWLRALAGRYADFLQATEESLLFTAKQLQLELSADKRRTADVRVVESPDVA